MGIEIKVRGEVGKLVIFASDIPRCRCNMCGVKVIAGVCTGLSAEGEASINWQNMTIYHESRCGIEAVLARRTATAG